MKTVLTLLTTSFVIFSSCSKNQDVPSLHEQMNGRWRVETYTKETWNPASNTVTKQVVTCSPTEYMDFRVGHILVKFDTTSVMDWNYNIVDGRNLDIENRNWTIGRLERNRFELVLSERDSSIKNWDAVHFLLTR